MGTGRTPSGKAVHRVVVSVTDLWQFKRLVQFADEIRELAEANGDEELGAILTQLADDLLESYE